MQNVLIHGISGAGSDRIKGTGWTRIRVIHTKSAEIKKNDSVDHRCWNGELLYD
jgi:hypothetical protein